MSWPSRNAEKRINIVQIFACIAQICVGFAFVFSPMKNSFQFFKGVYGYSYSPGLPIWTSALLLISPVYGLFLLRRSEKSPDAKVWLYHVKAGLDVTNALWWTVGLVFFSFMPGEIVRCLSKSNPDYTWDSENDNVGPVARCRGNSEYVARCEFVLILLILILHFVQLCCLLVSLLFYVKHHGCCCGECCRPSQPVSNHKNSTKHNDEEKCEAKIKF